MSSNTKIIRAFFDRAEAWEAAVRALQHAGQHRIEFFSPAPCPQLDRLTSPSPVRVWTLIGALVGLVGGLFMTIGTALAWPLITGGKAIVSIPPFLIIVFELTILCAALATLGGLFVLSGLPFSGKRGYHPAFSDDRFGIVIDAVPAGQAKALSAELRTRGAVEVENVE